MSEKAILFDASHCTGCKGCQVACKRWNYLPAPTGLNESYANWTSSYQNPPDVNGDTRLIMTFQETDSPVKFVGLAIGRRACQHCTDAPCAKVCPSGALEVTEYGFVTVHDEKCIGCHYCHSACPFDVPHYYGDKKIINKCTGCIDRIEHDMEPACVATCQPDALQFGDRDEMLELAHERLEFLQNLGYEDAFIYGETELGGSHVIQVLKYPIENYMLPENPQVPAFVGITQVMKPVVGVASAVTILGLGMMFGLGVGYKRDTLAYNVETEDTISVITGDVVKHGDGQDEKSVLTHIVENLPFDKAPLNKLPLDKAPLNKLPIDVAAHEGEGDHEGKEGEDE